MSPPAPIIKMRPWIEEFASRSYGIMGLVARRQCGKTYGMAQIILRRMGRQRGSKHIYMASSLGLSRELIYKEASVWRTALLDLRKAAAAAKDSLQVGDGAHDLDSLDLDAFAEAFEAQRMEAKLWFDRSTCSRLKLIAANPDTAVGEDGSLYMDEISRMKACREVCESAFPFVTSNPRFSIIMATTPPPQDDHHSFELLAPKDDNFPVNPRGNWYRSPAGYPILRADAFDTHAAGFPIFDDLTREPVTPEQHRAAAFDKAAWDRNFGCKFLRGGVGAIAFADLHHAQQAGADEGFAIDFTDQLRAV